MEKEAISEVHAKHILVKTEQEAKDLYEKIKKGEITFEKVAKDYSKCPSGSNGGDLGFFRRGVMVKEFEETAFSMKKGEVSLPVKTQFGWHLICVVDKK
ncbi:MAG: peptidyl-prolyl cis-trans isomerase [Alphaproteobacteria bacterium]|nr:peptidyl-prolyl cis-trans isomerase [Alphaproteobacteria bacterium]